MIQKHHIIAAIKGYLRMGASVGEISEITGFKLYEIRKIEKYLVWDEK
jgi:hypothetical protein